MRSKLEQAVSRNLADAMLFSGGLDTSIVACLASRVLRLRALTLALEGAPHPDLPYALIGAKHLGLDHSVHYFGLHEIMERLQTVVRALRTFDPMEIRNSVAIQIGLEALKNEGYSAVLTGDGGDELFAGYSFFLTMSMQELASKLESMWSIMRFSAIELARCEGMVAKTPYLDVTFQELAKSIPPELKVRSENGKLYGKWILRKTFELDLPGELVWREKLPIEVGTGTTTLPARIKAMIPPEEYKRKVALYRREHSVALRDPEHLAYYEVYSRIFGKPKPDASTTKVCPGCRSNADPKANFCRICGAFPI